MQTFLPYPDFKDSLMILDKKRLLKQRVESKQLLRMLDPYYRNLLPTATIELKGSDAWKNHPAYLMWLGLKDNPTMFSDALALYYNYSIAIAEEKYNSCSILLPYVKLKKPIVCLPPWFGDDSFHRSHKSNLLRKNYYHYIQFKGFKNIPDNLEYVWVYNNANFIKNYLLINNIISIQDMTCSITDLLKRFM